MKLPDLLYQNRWTITSIALVLILSGVMFLFRPKDQSAQAYAETATLEPVSQMTATSTATTTMNSTITPMDTPTLTPTRTPTNTPTKTLAPTATETPTPTATPRPAFLIWSAAGQGGYLRETPNGKIVTLLENGIYLESLGEKTKEAGLEWLHVLAYFPGAYQRTQQNGWVAKMLLYPVPDGTLAQVASDEGAYLRADPQGNILTWLGDGTPLVLLEEEANADNTHWLAVQTLDDQSGWVLNHLLKPLSLER